MNIYLFGLHYFTGGYDLQVAGPYELIVTVLAMFQFVSTLIMVVGKRRKIRMVASFGAAVFGGLAFVVYVLNQTAVGNRLYPESLLMFGGGVVYGIFMGIYQLRKVRQAAKGV